MKVLATHSLKWQTNKCHCLHWAPVVIQRNVFGQQISWLAGALLLHSSTLVVRLNSLRSTSKAGRCVDSIGGEAVAETVFDSVTFALRRFV